MKLRANLSRIEILGKSVGGTLYNWNYLKKNYTNTRLIKNGAKDIHRVSEGFSMGVLEAMAHGLSLITREERARVKSLRTDGFVIEKPGRMEVTTVGKDVMMICYNKINVKEYIKMLLSDLQLCESIGKNVWETSKKYSWEQHTNRLLHASNSMLTIKSELWQILNLSSDTF